MSPVDADLERRIEQERVAMTESTDADDRRAHADEMRRLINSRSLEQIERMETDRGLR